MVIIMLKNISYPQSREVRDKIRTFHRIKSNDGKSWSGDRLIMADLSAGQIIQDPPEDLVESWLRDGLASDDLASVMVVVAEEEVN